SGCGRCDLRLHSAHSPRAWTYDSPRRATRRRGTRVLRPWLCARDRARRARRLASGADGRRTSQDSLSRLVTIKGGSEMPSIGRHVGRLLAGFAAATLVMQLGGVWSGAHAQDEVKIAMIAPISGPWARQGELMRLGAEMAIDEINEQGGIKALGGAKLRLVVADAGDTAEKAKNAAQRVLAQEPDLIGGTGAWLSSFTLAVTEVTEREGLPWMTLSYSDAITERGFRYVFQTSATGGAQARAALPTIVELAETTTGKRPETVALIMDNTAAPVSFAKPMREGLIEELGLELVVDEMFTPPLSDATPLVQRVRSARPDIVMLLPTAIPDDKLLLEKLHEFRIRVPVVANGA